LGRFAIRPSWTHPLPSQASQGVSSGSAPSHFGHTAAGIPARSMFTSAVAKGRKVSVEHVRADMGQGRVLSASDALAAGMIDGVDTFDAVIRRMQKADKPARVQTSARAQRARDLDL